MIKCLLVGGPADGRLEIVAHPVFAVAEIEPLDIGHASIRGPLPEPASYKRHIYRVREIWPHPPMAPLIACPAFRDPWSDPEDGSVAESVWRRCFEAGAVMPIWAQP